MKRITLCRFLFPSPIEQPQMFSSDVTPNILVAEIIPLRVTEQWHLAFHVDSRQAIHARRQSWSYIKCSNRTHPEKDPGFIPHSSRNAFLSANCLQAGKPRPHEAVLAKVEPAGWEKCLFPFVPRGRSSPVLCPVLDSSVQAMPTNWRKSSKGLWR